MDVLKNIFPVFMAIFSLFIIIRNVIALNNGKLPKEHQKNNGDFLGMNSIKYQTAIAIFVLIASTVVSLFHFHIIRF